MNAQPAASYIQFNRTFFHATEDFTVIGSGEPGGKARGLAFIKQVIAEHDFANTLGIAVSIPTLTVITTEYFDEFMQQNDLYDVVCDDDLPDYILAHKFQQASLPVMLLGDLRGLVEQVHTPLAIRSSSLLEDAMYEPFAGIYETKMIPNNQASADVRFQKLVEAIKFVYASTFFKQAKDYLKATGHGLEDEKMAVIIQEVVGLRHGDRFYPNISGVARSHNFYPMGRARPEDGVVNLALGLGKTIVDGGISWVYSPAYPKVFPPHATARELLNLTQLHFWAVNMGNPGEYDPTKETEYLMQIHVTDAERDGTLDWVASTYDARSDRLTLGLSGNGPRALTFAPILALGRLPLNDAVKRLLTACKEAVDNDVEIEFALTFDPKRDLPVRFGFLQVRPMVVSHEVVEISDEETTDDRVLTRSENVMGNGIVEQLTDIVYVKPQAFDAKHTPRIAQELAEINAHFLESGRSYLLIGFGRWGSADPWLGIPVNWSQINCAKVIIEATLPQMNPDLSQGSHFFHNITSFQVLYFSVKHSGQYRIDWDWLQQQRIAAETEFVCHIQLVKPLTVKVDGRKGAGVIFK